MAKHRTSSPVSANCSIVILCLALVLMVTSCGTSSGPIESFQFNYVFAPRVNPNSYEVTRADPNCQNAWNDHMRLDQIAMLVQTHVPDYDSVKSCSTQYLIAGVEAQRVREHPLINFKLEMIGGQNDVQIFGNKTVATGATTEPTGIFIQTTGGLTVGQKTNVGFAEIYFGGNGPVFRCENGGLPWDANIRQPDQDTFFEFTLTSLDRSAGTAGGEFQGLARNINDPSDTRLLVIMDGGFFMTID